MSPYEQAQLFKEMIELGSNGTMNYISVLFAFLVAAYLVAPHLNRVMSGIVVGTFTVFAGLMILTVNRSVSTTAALVEEMRRAAGEGGASVPWHPAVYEPFNITAVFAPTLTALLAASYVAAIVFFFYARQRQLGGGLSI